MKAYEIDIDIDKLVRRLHYSKVLNTRIDNKTLLVIIKSFSEYIMSLYKTMLYESIYSIRYKGNWEPIKEEGYIDYLGTEPKVPILDLMYDALEIREIKNHIVIRFDPAYMYPDSKYTLIGVVKAIDNGTSKFNSRPVVKKIVRQLNHNLPTLWSGYLSRKEWGM